jgi:hypothetical protein
VKIQGLGYRSSIKFYRGWLIKLTISYGQTPILKFNKGDNLKLRVLLATTFVAIIAAITAATVSAFPTGASALFSQHYGSCSAACSKTTSSITPTQTGLTNPEAVIVATKTGDGNAPDCVALTSSDSGVNAQLGMMSQYVYDNSGSTRGAINVEYFNPDASSGSTYTITATVKKCDGSTSTQTQNALDIAIIEIGNSASEASTGTEVDFGNTGNSSFSHASASGGGTGCLGGPCSTDLIVFAHEADETATFGGTGSNLVDIHGTGNSSLEISTRTGSSTITGSWTSSTVGWGVRDIAISQHDD